MFDPEQSEFRLCEECSGRVREMRPRLALAEVLKVLRAMRALNRVVEDFRRGVRTLNHRYIERMSAILNSEQNGVA